MKTSPLICLIGASGSGKTAVQEYLTRMSNLVPVISYTTRAPRTPNEPGHKFCTREDYEREECNGNVIAHVNYNMHDYFATKSDVDEADIYIIDPKGFIDLLRRYSTTREIISVFLDVSPETRFERMRNEGRELRDIERRITNDATDIVQFAPYADYVIGAEDVIPAVALQVYEIFIKRSRFE